MIVDLNLLLYFHYIKFHIIEELFFFYQYYKIYNQKTKEAKLLCKIASPFTALYSLFVVKNSNPLD